MRSVRGQSEHYRTLGLEPGASAAEIKEAYRDLAKVWHPDRFAHDERLRAKADEKLREINAAYRALREGGEPAEASPPKAKPAPAPAPPPTPVVVAPAPPAERQRPKSAPRPATAARRSKRWPILLGMIAVAALVIGAVKYGERRGAERSPAGHASTAAADAAVSAGATADAADTAGATADAAVEAIVDAGRMLTTAADAGAPTDYFTLGSTEEQVLAVMGPPNSTFAINGVKWFWDMDTVHFRDGRVVAWDQSFDRRLKVKLLPRDAAVAERARQRGYLELGSSEDEVLGVQGTPDRIIHIAGTQWHYGMAHVSFTGRRVSGWFQSNDRDLRLPPGAPEHR